MITLALALLAGTAQPAWAQDGSPWTSSSDDDDSDWLAINKCPERGPDARCKHYDRDTKRLLHARANFL